MDLYTLVLLVMGLVLLVAGAELLVRGASALAVLVGVSPLVIGLTVVAYGTSTPELAVSTRAAWIGQSDIALGNVVGSNIFNVLFILGLSALISPLAVSRQIIRRETPIMIGVSILLLLMALDGQIGRIDGLVLVAGVVLYTVLSIRQSRRETAAAAPAHPAIASGHGWKHILLQVLLILGGLALLGVGTDWLVNGAVAMAKAMGVSELVIGLTIVAAGTSLPEVATSVMATIRGQRDIAIGNIVGSNIYNILAVLGAAAAIRPVNVSPQAMGFDLPVMVAVAVVCLPVFVSGRIISRLEGVLFLGYYIAYTVYLVLAARAQASLALYGHMMLWFILPASGVLVLVAAARQMFSRRPARAILAD